MEIWEAERDKDTCWNDKGPIGFGPHHLGFSHNVAKDVCKAFLIFYFG